jgi:tetratricopeptide (TPR) repeat protein
MADSILKAVRERATDDDGTLQLIEGSALALSGQDPARAEALLASAVKLLPHATRAWALLVDLLWARRDPETALAMARRWEEAARAAAPSGGDSLVDSTTVRLCEALRAQSSLERAVPTPDGVARSVRAALAAIEASAHCPRKHDPESWASLGLAWFSAFYNGPEAVAAAEAAERGLTTPSRAAMADALRSALNAYGMGVALGQKEEAEALEGAPDARLFPDLHFNRGHCLALCLRYGPAIASFARAHHRDPSLGGMAVASNLRRQAVLLGKAVEAHGHLSPRKLDGRMAALPRPEDLASWLARPEAEGGGAGRSLVDSPLSSLAPRLPVDGSDIVLEGKAVVLLPLSRVTREEETPAMFACVDGSRARVALALYGALSGPVATLVAPRCWVAVLDPHVSLVRLDLEQTAALEAGATLEDPSADMALCPPLSAPVASTTASASSVAPTQKRKPGKPAKRSKPAQTASTAASLDLVDDGKTSGVVSWIVVKVYSLDKLCVNGGLPASAGLRSGLAREPFRISTLGR